MYLSCGDAAATNSKKTLEKRSGFYTFGKKSEQVEEKFERTLVDYQSLILYKTAPPASTNSVP